MQMMDVINLEDEILHRFTYNHRMDTVEHYIFSTRDYNLIRKEIIERNEKGEKNSRVL